MALRDEILRRELEQEQTTHILVVDDEAAIRRLLEPSLRQLAHHVDSDEDGRDALRRLDDGDYDRIISDLRLPGIGGEDLLYHLRAMGSGLERHLIFITGDAAGTRAARLAAEAGVPMLVKPVHLIDLARVIEAASRD